MSKKYFYCLARSHYEEYNPRVFVSEQYMTQEKFRNFVRGLLHTAVKNLMREEHTFITVYDVMREVWRLMELHGFQPLGYTALLELWGTLYLDGYNGYPDDENTTHIINLLGKELAKKIEAYNKRGRLREAK